MKQSLFAAALLFLLSCNNGRNSDIKNAVDSAAVIAQPVQNSDAANAAINFLKWYKQHRDTITKIEMVNNVTYGENEKGKPYSVNFGKAQEYLSALRASGYISDKYMSNQMDYYKKCDKYFKENPELGGPPVGFDFDLVLWTQEIESTLAAIDTAKVMEQVTGSDTAAVTLDVMMQLKFRMSKAGGKRLIDNIENVTQLH